MLDIQYKTITVGKRERLVIEILDEGYEALATFLNTDYIQFADDVDMTIESVLVGEEEEASFAGNVCSISVTPEVTVITDELADDDISCEIDTEEFIEIIGDWAEMLE